MLVDCLMQVYRIGFLVTSLPVNCNDMGLDVISVNALNKIMEKMGLLIHYGNGWGTTDAGAKFSMWDKGVLNSDSWHPELVDEIAKFLKDK